MQDEFVPEHPAFEHGPDPDNPGWTLWNLKGERFNGFLGSISIRRDGDEGLVRMRPEARHSNLADVMHGGATMGFVDVVMFAGCRALGLDFNGRGVTVEAGVQFVGAGLIGLPLEGRLEIVRETRSLIFVRGLCVQYPEGQDRHIVVTFSGIIKKAPAGK